MTRFVDRGVFVDRHGHGTPVVCLHGIGSSSRSFLPLARVAPPGVELLAWDAPGYGRSTDPDQPLDLDGYVAAALALISDLGRPVHLVGVSWGGFLAMRLAARSPEALISVALIDSTRGSARSEQRRAAMRARGAELGELGATEFARRRAGRLLRPGAPEPDIDAVAKDMAEAIRLPGYGWAAESMAANELSDELARIQAPTLVLVGEHDTVTGVEESRAIAGLVPGAAFGIVPGAGHLAAQERPELVMAWLSCLWQLADTSRQHAAAGIGVDHES